MTEISQDEGVNEFLQRIRELGDKRDREDDERTRKLEEEILAGRQARQARRAERAKSLSPTKDSPSGHSRGSRNVQLDLGDIPKLEQLEPEVTREDALQGALEKLTGTNDTSGYATESPPASTSLPWQRPLGSDRASTSETKGEKMKIESSISQLDHEFSRSDISRNLAAKDISFFSQSSDRKVSSDALRKDAEQQMGGSARAPLPGMTHLSSIGNGRRDSAGNAESMQLEPTKELQRPFSASGSSRTAFGSVRLTPSVNQDIILDDQIRQPAMSPSQGRMSPEKQERTPSPTKGFGSFVQSAMLKRENSISKRWNPNAGGSISRNNSTANAWNNTSPARGREPTPSALSRESSPALEDKPIKVESPDRDVFSHNRARAKSIVGSLSGYSTNTSSIRPETPTSVKKDVTPPTSPSKTYDQKRWSPTKASWLEVALKKGTEGSPTSLKNTPTMDMPVKEPPPRAPAKPLTYAKPATLASKATMDLPSLGSSSVVSKPLPAEKPVSLGKPITLTPASSKLPPPVSEKPSSIGSRPIPGTKGSLDFRANLKPRNSPGTSPEREELPFLNAMSRLRSTRTQNYVAPNELKEQILAGKANLQLSGGPQKSQLPDPLKETVTSAKAALKHSNTSISPSELAAKPKPPPPTKQSSAPGRIEAEKPSVVNRIPNLASLLSRGPVGINSPRNISGATTSSGYSSGIPEEREGNKIGDAPLIHVTKTRAKGPKRRQPTRAATSNGETEARRASTPKRIPSATVKRVPSINSELSKPVPATPPKPSALGVKSMKPEYHAPTVDDEPENSIEKLGKAKPPTPAKSPLLFAKTDLKEDKSRDTTPIPSPSVEKSPHLFSPEAPVNNATPPVISVSNVSSQPAGPRTLNWLARRPTPNTQATAAPKGESPQENKFSENDDTVGELNLRPSIHQPPVLKAPVPGEVLEYLKPSRISGSGSSPVSPIVRKVSVGTLADNTGELNNFFKSEADPLPELDVEKFLSYRPEIREKVETEKIDVWEVTGEGKVQTVPTGEEHTLFDESMYLVLHHFTESSGKNAAEVYLWRGSSVSTATFDDAEHFAQKMAEESDAKLIFIQQGKETPEFLMAIGGIIVTRRGSSSSKDALPYMLCARSFSTGIAFDEEELQSSFLCSGFPFLINSQERLYLWKGKGTSVDELNAAKSMAMVLSSGKFEEVEEGHEPEALLGVLKGQGERASADYWQLKPAYKNYGVRLFKFDQQSDSKVYEISPFCQADLDSNNIYALDAFFEVYIVIGANSQAKKTEFQTALKFTQEYSKASAVSGRPYSPPTFILLGGVSREFRAVFRSWQQKHIPTTWTPSRKPSLRIVGLEEAKRAMNMDA